MPAAYAHHRFGGYCISVMPEKYKQICTEYREIFDFGVHGPDILFYYKPLSHNEVNRHGNELHHFSGEEFFEHCKAALRDKGSELPEQDMDALMAYILGFLAHFALDSNCHGYINQTVIDSEYSHNLIESQYEAYLMRLDGLNPLKVDRSQPLKPGKHTAHIIAQLFPFSETQVRNALEGQKSTLKMFYSPREIKKGMIRKLISIAGIKGSFGDLFIDKEIIPACGNFNSEIHSRYEKAEASYPELLQELDSFLQTGRSLGEAFKYDFEGVRAVNG